jgi:hypothetical protein
MGNQSPGCVDGGAAIDLMLYTMMCKIGKSDEDLTQTNMIFDRAEVPDLSVSG